jgi:hypothetical protein
LDKRTQNVGAIARKVSKQRHGTYAYVKTDIVTTYFCTLLSINVNAYGVIVLRVLRVKELKQNNQEPSAVGAQV